MKFQKKLNNKSNLSGFISFRIVHIFKSFHRFCLPSEDLSMQLSASGTGAKLFERMLVGDPISLDTWCVTY
jgi:hypothetical protein